MLSTAVAVSILAGTLSVFIIAVGLLSWKHWKQFWKINEDFISARKSQEWYSIGLSLFAGAMGSWCLTAPAQTAALGGCWALIGYAFAMSMPWTLYLWAGPIMRKRMGRRGFTCLEFLEEQFGRVVQFIIAAGSVLTMWIFLVAELSTIGFCFVSLSPDTPAVAAIVSIAVVTMLYSALGGLRASILTDKIQSLMTILLVITCYTVTFSTVAPNIKSSAWSESFHWNNEGIIVGLSLTLGALFVELLNQATWQRVFASKDEWHLKVGFSLGMILVFGFMIIVGLVGNFAKAAALSDYISMEEGEEYNSLFLLVGKLPTVWLGIVLIMAIGLVASSVDSLQTGLSAMIASDLVRHGLSLNWARALCILLNIPAIIYASYDPPSILQLLVAGNVVSTAMGPAILLGFWHKTTSNGIICSIFFGLLSVPCVGWWRTNTFKDGVLWFQFPNGYNWECLLTFTVEIVVTFVICISVSLLETYLRPSVVKEREQRLRQIHEKTMKDNQLEEGEKAQDGKNPTVQTIDADEHGLGQKQEIQQVESVKEEREYAEDGKSLDVGSMQSEVPD